MFNRNIFTNKQPKTLLLIIEQLSLKFCFVALWSFITLGPQTKSSNRLEAILFLCLYILFVIVFGTIIDLRHYRRARWKEQQRILLSRDGATQEGGQQSELSVVTLEPDAGALSLPFSIEERVNFWYVAIMLSSSFAIVIVLIVIGISTRFLKVSSGSTTEAYIIFMIIVFIAFILTGVMFFTFVRQQLYQRIEVSEHGLTTIYRGNQLVIRWDEARFFSRSGLPEYPNLGANRYTALYELQSDKENVQWQWHQRRNKMSYTVPALSQEEYNQAMEKLNALIAARTGLALYDLRRPRKAIA